MPKRTSFSKKDQEFDQSIIDLARVTRVMAGGKRLRFRVCMVIGDRKGRVGYAVAKGADVASAVSKAVTKAKKHLITVPIVNDTIPHDITAKFSAAEVLLKSAPSGTGIIAGGAMRTVLEFAGINNVVAKNVARTSNKISIVKATFKALTSLTPPVEEKKPPKLSDKKVHKAAV